MVFQLQSTGKGNKCGPLLSNDCLLGFTKQTYLLPSWSGLKFPELLCLGSPVGVQALQCPRAIDPFMQEPINKRPDHLCVHAELSPTPHCEY